MVVENFESRQSGQSANWPATSGGPILFDAIRANSGSISMRIDFRDGRSGFGGYQNMPEGVGVGETLWFRTYIYLPSTLSLSYGDQNGDGFGWNKFIVLSRQEHDGPRMYLQPRSGYKLDFGDPGFVGTGLYVNHDGLGRYCRLLENSYAFPRDRWFALQISWHVATNDSAYIRIWADEEFLGECSGGGRVSAGYVVQFYGFGDYWNGGAWIRGASTGSFWVDDIVVTKQAPNTIDNGGRPFIHPANFR